MPLSKSTDTKGGRGVPEQNEAPSRKGACSICGEETMRRATKLCQAIVNHWRGFNALRKNILTFRMLSVNTSVAKRYVKITSQFVAQSIQGPVYNTALGYPSPVTG